MPEAELLEPEKRIVGRFGKAGISLNQTSIDRFNSQKSVQPIILRRNTRTVEAAREAMETKKRRLLQTPITNTATSALPADATEEQKIKAAVKDVTVDVEKDMEKRGISLREVAEFIPSVCEEEDCRRMAVGASGKCRMHGGRVDEILLRKDYECTQAHLKAEKYDPTIHPVKYIALAQQGLSDAEIAAQFLVSVQKMLGWADQFESFQTAYEIGKTLYEAWWLGEARENLDNSRYNTGLFKFITMNKLGYSEKQESKNLNVHAGVLVVPGVKTEEEWEAAYAGKK